VVHLGQSIYKGLNMDDKNELNDLLLGNQKENGSSKKFFLIAAGVLLLFFIIIGIMKFMGTNETKQPLPITSGEQMKKMPSPVATQNSVPQDANAVGANTNATAGADDKLNAIVKKLQQDAQKQSSTPSTTPVVQTTPNEQVVVKSEQVPVVTKPVTQTTPKEPKTTVVSVPIKTAAEQPVKKPKEAMREVAKKDDVKTAFKDATKNVVKQKKEQPAKQVVKSAQAKPETKQAETASSSYYVQVGYFESEKSTKGISDKINSIGLGSTTRQSVKNDKNITKVWVGPFDSKDSATKALPKIREQIKNDAFVVKG